MVPSPPTDDLEDFPKTGESPVTQVFKEVGHNALSGTEMSLHEKFPLPQEIP